jgi:hypothetical protein
VILGLLVYGDIASGQVDYVGLSLLESRVVIREDFADTQSLVSICFLSLISTSDFVKGL